MIVCDVRTAKFGPLFDRLAIDRSHCRLPDHPRLANAIIELMQGSNAPTIENVLLPHDKAQDSHYNSRPGNKKAEAHHA